MKNTMKNIMKKLSILFVLALTINLVYPTYIDANAASWKSAYAKKVKSYEKKNKDKHYECKYSLVYIDNNKTPELVCDKMGYTCSVYTFKKGKVVELATYGYGVGGIYPPSYAHKKNILCQTDMDGAGYDIYETYYKIKDNKIKNVATVHSQYNEKKKKHVRISGKTPKAAKKVKNWKSLTGTMTKSQILKKL